MPYLDIAIADRVATITINDPKRRNALNLDMCDEMRTAIGELEANPDVGALVVTGAPPAFCAGADLSHLGADNKREGLLAIYEGFLLVGRSPLPSIAAVNGAAVGAGMNLALICDVRLAGRSARFDSRFLDLGLHPGGGHTWMLRRTAGPQAAFAVDVFGEVLDGAEAERIGLVWRCVEDDQLLAEAQRMAARAASGPPELVRKMKQSIVDMGSIQTQADAVARELDPQVWSAEQPVFAEKLAALKAAVSSKKA